MTLEVDDSLPLLKINAKMGYDNHSSIIDPSNFMQRYFFYPMRTRKVVKAYVDYLYHLR